MNLQNPDITDLNSYTYSQVTTPIVMTWLCLIIAMTWGFDNPHTALQSFDSIHPWSWISTHFTHSSLGHLIKNLMALWLVYYLFPIKPAAFIAACMICIFMVSCFALSQDIQHYLGLSALLYIFPGFYFMQLLQNHKFMLALLIITFLIVYTFFITPAVQTVKPPFIAAHIMGFISGSLTKLFMFRRT